MCPDPEDSDDAAVCDIGAHSAGGEVRRHGGDPDQDRAGVRGVRCADAASLVPVLPAGAVASLGGFFMCQDSSVVS